MSAVLRQTMTLDGFLTWEARQESRWEFDGFAPVAMTGGTLEHGLIQGNLITALNIRLRGSLRRAAGSDVKVLVSGSIRYPDAFVFCSTQRRGTTVVADPVVIFEILSPSTAGVDRVVKNQEYRDTPSIQRYVMLEQDRQAATVFARADDDWVGHIVSGDTILEMPEIGISVPLAELYEGVVLGDRETEAG